MKKVFYVLLALCAILTIGCTQKIVKVTFNQTVEDGGEASLEIYSDGSNITTDDDPTNSPDISPEVSLEGLGGL